MATSLRKMLWAFSVLETGRACRRCGEAIPEHDPFGVSEGVCAPCRRAPDT